MYKISISVWQKGQGASLICRETINIFSPHVRHSERWNSMAIKNDFWKQHRYEK